MKCDQPGLNCSCVCSNGAAFIEFLHQALKFVIGNLDAAFLSDMLKKLMNNV